ncbi:MAG: CoA transferase [Geminicoccaceae bacterium]
MLAVLEPQTANYRLTEEVKPRIGSRSSSAPRNVCRTRDGGWVCLSASTQGMSEKLFRSIGRPELIEDQGSPATPTGCGTWRRWTRSSPLLRRAEPGRDAGAFRRGWGDDGPDQGRARPAR